MVWTSVRRGRALGAIAVPVPAKAGAARGPGSRRGRGDARPKFSPGFGGMHPRPGSV